SRPNAFQQPAILSKYLGLPGGPAEPRPEGQDSGCQPFESASGSSGRDKMHHDELLKPPAKRDRHPVGQLKFQRDIGVTGYRLPIVRRGRREDDHAALGDPDLIALLPETEKTSREKLSVPPRVDEIRMAPVQIVLDAHQGRAPHWHRSLTPSPVVEVSDWR